MRAGLFAACAGVLLLAGCHKPKAEPVPPQAQAPAIPPPATTQADPTQPPPAETTPVETKAETSVTQQPAPAPPAPAPKPKTHHNTKKTVPAPSTPPATVPGDAPGKTVVPQGSTSSTGTQLTPNLSQGEAERTRQDTVQLLAATEANLKNLAQSLTREEQAMVEEIHSYMAQARTAMSDGDLMRAHNLADKAHQLSKALPKK